MEENQNRGNEVKIADREIRIYLGECLLRFQKFDQIILSAGESFVDKALYIQHILNSVGVEIDKGYKNKVTGKPIMTSEVKEVQNEKSGRYERKKFFKLGLTKIPELFMRTDEDKAIDIPPLDEEEPEIPIDIKKNLTVRESK